MPGISIAQARDAVQRLAAARTRTREEERLAEHLQHATGIPVDELARLTKEWPAT